MIYFGLKKIIKLYRSGNVSLSGLRGTGKDLLTGNIISRRKRPYISNVEYTKKNDSQCIFIPLNLKDLNLPYNYKDLINNDFSKSFIYKYPRMCDIYISDCGIYLPSQYCNNLNKEYEGLIEFQQLSRHIGNCNLHTNTQALNRVWDKLREQSEIYIRCNWCKFIFSKFVIQKITIYEKYESCLNNVKKCRISTPLFATKEQALNVKLYKDNFTNQNGVIKTYILIYKNKSKHNPFMFEDLIIKKEKL